jgi:uncharacterized membrane protein
MTDPEPVPATSAAPTTPTAPAALEAALARLLQVGTYVSLALIAIGTALLLAGGGSPLDAGPQLDLPNLGRDLAAGRAPAFLWLGVLGVLATPGLRVLGALIGFARAGEWRMVGVAVAIIVVVALGIVAGVMTG